jgi:hypothetical protein
MFPRKKRTKLEPAEKKGIFVGYSETLKAYRIYIPRQRQIEISRDVTFDEDEAFRRSRESHTDEDREEQEAPREEIMVDSTLEELVDRPFSIGGQLMCHEEMHHQMPMLSKTFGSTGQCLAPALIFVIRISAPLRGLIM